MMPPCWADGTAALCALDLADCDRRCVSSGLVGSGRKIRKRCVCRVTGVDAKRLGVGTVESFDERFGGECPAAGCAGFDPRGLVYFFAEGGDFAATAGEDPTDVQRRAPVQSEPRRKLGRCDLAARRNVGEAVAQCPSGGNAGSRRS